MLRTLILFVIFLNLAFFYWARENDFDREDWSHPKTVGNYDPILLISESENTQANNVEVTTDKNPEQGRSLMCFSIGPFDNSESSDEMYDALFDLGIQAKQRIVNERKPKSYWVYLPSKKSKSKAEETVDFLKDNDVEETYIWLDAPHRYAVSLGLFSRLTIARNKITEIENLGLKPKMDVRYNEFTEFWVDYRRETDSSQPKELEEMLRENDRLLILETNCP